MAPGPRSYHLPRHQKRPRLVQPTCPARLGRVERSGNPAETTETTPNLGPLRVLEPSSSRDQLSSSSGSPVVEADWDRSGISARPEKNWHRPTATLETLSAPEVQAAPGTPKTMDLAASSPTARRNRAQGARGRGRSTSPGKDRYQLPRSGAFRPSPVVNRPDTGGEPPEVTHRVCRKGHVRHRRFHVEVLSEQTWKDELADGDVACRVQCDVHMIYATIYHIIYIYIYIYTRTIPMGVQ